MNIKGKSNIFLYVIIASVIIGIYFYATGSNIISVANRGSNGWYDPTTQQCWSTPTGLQGGTLPSYSCCFDQEGYQVDCQGPNRLSTKPLIFAIFFPAGGTSTPGKYWLATTIGITNTANTDFSKVWIESADWTSSPSYLVGNTELNNKFLSVEGFNNAMAGPLIQGGTPRYFSTTGTVNLQTLSLNRTSPEVYTGIILAKGSYTAGGIETNISSTKTLVFTVTKEEAGFSVDVTLVAT